MALTKRIMKRTFLLFFILLVLSFMLNAQQKLLLREVSVDTTNNPQQKINLKWKYKDIGTDKLDIYRCGDKYNNENCYLTEVKVKMDPDSLIWIDVNADVHSIFGYDIGCGDSCRGKTGLPLNNMVLKVDSIKEGCKNSVLLSWNPYINMPDSLDYYKIFCRTNEKSAFDSIATKKGKHFTGYCAFPDRHSYENRICDSSHHKIQNIRIQDTINLESNTEYEFVVQAINKTRTESSFSNIVKHKTKDEKLDKVPISINSVSVTKENHIQIEVSTESFFRKPEKLCLYRAESEMPVVLENSLSFQNIHSFGYHSGNSYSYKDETVKPQNYLYYYKVIAENPCKDKDTSNIKTNIRLRGDRTEKYIDSIHFVQIGFPELAQNSYELYRVINQSDEIIKGGLQRNTTYDIEVTQFLNDGAEVKYKIKSPQGEFSNTIIVKHEPIIEFADAFYPQSRNLENQTFYPIIKFSSDSHYLFIIYDRWGQEIFRSTKPPDYCFYEGIDDLERKKCINKNKEERRSWDGTFQGKECPPGIYAFKTSYLYGENNQKYSYSGTFMLIR